MRNVRPNPPHIGVRPIAAKDTSLPIARPRGTVKSERRMAIKATLVASGWALCLVAAGCGGSSSDPDIVQRSIGPDGGTLSSPDSVLTIAIPPGALTETLDFFIQHSNEPDPSAGEAYLVRPSTELLFDATVTYRGSLPSDVSTLAVGAVDPIAFEEGRGQWVALPLLRVDEEQELVTGIDSQVSIFYTLLSGVRPSSTTTNAGTTGTEPPATDGDEMGTTGGDTDPATTDAMTTTGVDTDDMGTTSAESSGEPAISFAEEIQPILTANCNCHIDGAPMGLSMVDGYANLVNVASAEAAGLDRIEPGVLEDSYLWHKISGTHIAAGGEGNPMPAPDGGLDPALIATIEEWITDGAEP